jgi:hypothetical protein
MPRSTNFSLLVLCLTLAAAPAARGQVVGGVLTVTGAEMH